MGSLWLLGTALVLFLGACDGDGGTLPGNLREGQIGEISVTLEAPLSFSQGELTQVLTWGSSGAWSLQEEIRYRGLVGDATFQRNVGDPSPLATEYASFITIINEVDALKLFIADSLLSTGGNPTCGVSRTRITLTLYDKPHDRTTQWVQCAEGSMSTLTPTGAGPDQAASRVVTAAILMRDATLGSDFLSQYHGSVPFGTLDRGDDTSADLNAPFYVLTQEMWNDIWQSHGGARPLPAVNFEEEMVVVAAVGQRQEAGDSVEVRRILQVDEGTLTFAVERVPGDFCSPAASSHRPFHMVVAPRTPPPHRFGDTVVERVSCGG